MKKSRELVPLAIACILTVAGCASAPVTHHAAMTPQEIRDARTAEMRCLTSAVKTLDDGVSPANVVGHQVGLMCSREIFGSLEYSIAKDLGDSYPTENDIEGAVSQLDSVKDEVGTGVVLRWRQMKRKADAASKAFAQREPAAVAAWNCLAAQIERRDDGSSPVNVVADEAEKACASELLAWGESHLSQRTPAAVQRAKQLVRAEGKSLATAMVSRYRKGGAPALQFH